MSQNSNISLPIIGAGLSGLIAATQFPNSVIYEKMKAPTEKHKALLRFRTPDVGTLTGIPFRKVKVYKEVFNGYICRQHASIKDMNDYSKKVTGAILSRSISSTDVSERYIAPDDFYSMLEDSLHNRIRYNSDFSFEEPCISTAPMPILAAKFGYDVKFNYNKSAVYRWRIPNADVFQTIYVTDPNNPIYRASITGDIFIVEATKFGVIANHHISQVAERFGIDIESAISLGKVDQQYGKINPIDERTRRHIISSLTDTFGIYSLGRFATWRNILLDDLVGDIQVVKRIIQQDVYEQRLRPR